MRWSGGWEVSGTGSDVGMKCLALVVFCLLAAATCAIRINTPLGEIEGKEAVSRDGRTYYAFTKVPYARPPLGPLRLKNPVSHPEWSGVLDATALPPLCTQVPVFVASLRNYTLGHEDCLYLRIFTPKVKQETGRERSVGDKLPVLVYVHGGGFRCGHVGPEEAPRFFMDEDVVLVLVQYRLGALGFLSTEDEQIPGNFGLKDQALALRWIKENIASFGGDPARIVVFGESAGGASAHYLALSPLSSELLSGAIAESGVVDAAWALSRPGVAKKTAAKVAQLVGCETAKDLLACLQQVPSKELIRTELDFLVWDFDPAVVFQPTIEPKLEGAFLTQDPRQIKSNIPIITGIVSAEGLLKTASLRNQEDSVLADFIDHVDEYLPSVLFIDPASPRLSDFLSIVKSRYFHNLHDKDQVIQALEDLYSDIFFIHPLHEALNRQPPPKYVYFFDHRAENSHVQKFGNNIPKDPFKVSHADELLSLFDWSSDFLGTEGRPQDTHVSRRLIRFWVNFAKNSNPTPCGLWKEYGDGAYLHITTEGSQMKENLMKNVTEFWSKALSVLEPSAHLKEEL